MAVKRAFTLMETLVYCGLAILLIVVILNIFLHVRQTGNSASSSFVLGQDTASGFDRLRRDFTETSLQSLRVKPKAGVGWVSMVGARDNTGNLLVAPHGVPAWNSYVCYTLDADTDGDGISSLRRFVVAHTFPGGIPAPSAQALAPGSTSDVVLNQVLAPNYRMGEVAGGSFAPVTAADNPEGGFVVRFRRAGATLSPSNPNESDDSKQSGWSKGSTGSLEIKLTMVERGSSGKYSSIELPILITPRH